MVNFVLCAKGIPYVDPFRRRQRARLSEGLCTPAVALSRATSNWGKDAPKGFSLSRRTSQAAYVNICRRLRCRVGAQDFFFLLLWLLFIMSSWCSATFEDRWKRRTFREQPDKTAQHNSCSHVAKRHNTLQKLPPALKPQWEFFSFFLSFRGTVVPNMVWTLLGPSSHFPVLCLFVSSRLSSALLPVTWELIWAHCLQACLNSWNASGEAARVEERRGCRRRRKRRCTDVPCVVVLSPCCLRYQKSDMLRERTNSGTYRFASSSCTSLTCLYCFLVDMFEAGMVLFLNVTHAFFIYPSWWRQGRWPSSALTVHFQIKGPTCKYTWG